MKRRLQLKILFNRDRLLTFWRNELRPLLLMATCLFAARSSFADWNHVPTGSMKPTILEGDLVLVNKLAYDLKVPFTTWRLAEWSSPDRGDIVVFYSPEDGTRMVKRVVGKPGDTVEMRNGLLWINHQRVSYEPLAPRISQQLSTEEIAEAVFANEHLGEGTHAVMGLQNRLAMRDFGPLTIPAEHVFVLGDNRDNSADSRYFGTLPMKNILGRAETVLVSFDHDHWHLPRAQRWIRGLDQ